MSGQQAVARPPVAELLEEPQGTWRGLITSHEKCIATRRQLSAAPIAELDHEAGQVDEFSYTSEAKQSYAYQLWQAMTDYSDYYEAKDDKSHFQVDRLKALSEIEMEVLAWEVLVSGPSAERRAPCLFHRYLTIVTIIGWHRERPQWPPRVYKASRRGR